MAHNLKAILFINLVAEGPVQPVHAKVNGLNVVFSTSMIHCSYLSFSDFRGNYTNLLKFSNIFLQGG